MITNLVDNYFIDTINFADSNEIIQKIGNKTQQLGFIALSAFSGVIAFALMLALIITGVKISYSSGEKRKNYIVHLLIILVVFVITIIIFSVGLKFAIDISKEAIEHSKIS
ncbi:Mbov_0395 family pilin-like conjugal transfer protein [Mesomycoplasma neurolyticum]|uniref:Uncharacterized protein n=1 Tax=Mesomycoplasma neurolyticum TaxID=2120 RepID=A0A449A4Q4_9BACT|nr:hypothetical protein [Mesomycoplasma neurolyticum]VEU59217.1 Uncharacterised protein [Mesomycoplasma neurolyticum]